MQIRQLLLKCIQQVIMEYRLDKEAQYTLQGFKIYHRPRKGIYSCRLIKQGNSPIPWIITTKQAGISVIDTLEYIKTNDAYKSLLRILYNALIVLYTMWVRNIFWGDGFFHADLHGGNILCYWKRSKMNKYTEKDDKTLRQAGLPRQPDTKCTPQIQVIDYGSCGKLSTVEKKKVFQCIFILQRVKMIRMYTLLKDFQNIPTGLTNAKVTPFSVSTFFKRTLTQDQVNFLELNFPAQVHRKNIEGTKLFIHQVLTVCNVDTKSVVISDQFVQNILQYDDAFLVPEANFGKMFLRCIQHLEDVGECVHNQMLEFGKGFLYIDNLCEKVRQTAEDLGVPVKQKKLKDLIKSFMQWYNVGNLVKSGWLLIPP